MRRCGPRRRTIGRAARRPASIGLAHRGRSHPVDAPDALDLIGIDGLLSDEERQIRGLAREWVADRILPEVDDWFERRAVPARELAKELGQLGFLGMQLPNIAGLGAVAYGLVRIGLEAGSSGS